MPSKSTIEIRDLSALRQDPRNARKHTARGFGMLVDTIQEVGAARSGVCDEDGVILAGNLTWEAMAEAGIDKVKIVDADGDEWVVVRRKGLTDKQKIKLAVGDNRIGALSEWDIPVLDSLDIDLGDLWFDNELAEMGIGIDEPAEDPGPQIDKAAELQEKWKVERGQVFTIGPHRLMCGDAHTDLDGFLNGVKPDLLFIDPPYGISVVKALGATDGGSKAVTIGSVRARRKYPFGGVKNMVGTDGSDHWVDATPYRPVHRDDKPFDPIPFLDIAKNAIMWGGNYYASKLSDSRCWIVWDKNNTGNFADAELAWTSFDRSVRLYQFTWNGLVREGSRDIEGVKRVHPTQKPVGLFQRILEDFTDEDATVLDTYLGSGTTLIACELTGRQGLGMEIDPAYCSVVLERMTGMGLEPQVM